MTSARTPTLSFALLLALIVLACPRVARADEPPPADPLTTTPQAPPPAGPVVTILPPGGQVPVTAAVEAWRARYLTARTHLVNGHYATSLLELQRLELSAPTPADRELAHELGEVARGTLARRAAEASKESLHLRTTDELGLLYGHAFVYGLGTAAWFILQTKPDAVAAAILPFAGFTIASVGSVAAYDHYKPFKRGVPYAISVGLYVGFGEGVWIVAYQHARSARIEKQTGHDPSWQSETVSTVLWTGATTGAIMGALIGNAREPSIGRTSFTASTTIWAGALAGMTTAALTPYGRKRDETIFIVGDAFYNAGLLGGLVLAPSLHPSIERVRFTDLAGIGGALVGTGIYLLAAESAADQRAGLGVAAAGGALGLTLGWIATKPLDDKEHATPSAPAVSFLQSMQPTLVPTPGGAQVGVAGLL